MAEKRNDINSTEKLLNVIRGKQEEADNGSSNTSITLPKELPVLQNSKRLSWLFPDKRNYTVGVDISDKFIHLVKTITASNGIPILADQKIIQYDNNLVHGSAEFNSLLKSAILSICGNPANCSIWTMMSARDVNIQHVKIPRVQKKQLENAIHWAAKKELSFDEKDSVFDYEIQGEITDQGIPKHLVMIYSAPKAEIERKKAIFSNIGISLSGITIAPFAIQNIFRRKWLHGNEKAVATLFIGNDFSRISIYDKDNLVMTRGIKTGTSSMLDAITEVFLENKGAIKLDREAAKKILFSLGPDSIKLSQADAGFGIKEEELFAMITPVIERLSRQIERTLQHYTTSMGSARVEELYISSAMNLLEPVSEYIREQLGVKSEVLDPFKYQGASKTVETIAFTDRMALVNALGLSFSDNQNTPNLIFTYQEENKEVSTRRIGRGIHAAFAGALVICLIIIISQGMDIYVLSKQKASLQKQVAMFNPAISAANVTKLVTDVKKQRYMSRQYTERYMGMAVIGEIAELTPENIRLNSLKIIASSNPAVKDKTDKKDETGDGLTMEGIVTGDRNMLDSYLAQYVMKMNNSPLLQQVSVQKNNIVGFKKKDVLQFTMSAKIGK